MTTTINGIDLEALSSAQHNDAVAIEVMNSHIAALEAHPDVNNSDIDALKAEIAALKAEDAAERASLVEQVAKVNNLAALLANLHPVSAEDIVHELIAAIATGINVTVSGGTGGNTGGSTGGNTGGTGTVTPPVVTPNDPNPWPMDMTAVADPTTAVWTYGHGPDQIDIVVVDNGGASHSSFNVGTDEGLPSHRFLLRDITLNRTFFAGGPTHVQLRGYFGALQNIFITGALEGIKDFYINAVLYNGEAWRDFSPGGFNSRSPKGNFNASYPLYNSGWAQHFLSKPALPDGTVAIPVGGPAVVVTPIAGATINGVPHADAKLAELVAATPAGGEVHVPGTARVHESVGNNAPMTISSDGKVSNPGSKDATFAGGAVLDGTSLDGSLVQNQGGFVALADLTLKGWEVTKFGYELPEHDGTGGIRPNSEVALRIEDCFAHLNQMGIGPHPGGTIRVKNTIFLDNGLPHEQPEPGYAHNIYTYADYWYGEGGITSIARAGSGDGHPFKLAAKHIEMYGKNYGCGWNTSVMDMPHGTETPFIIKEDENGGTTLEKLAGDPNTVIGGYCPESKNNGTAGGSYSGLTIVIPDDGRNYIWLCGAGEITFLPTCKFLYNTGAPVRPGGIVAQGTSVGTGIVNGLP